MFASTSLLWMDQPVKGKSVSEWEDWLVWGERKTRAVFGTDRISIVQPAPDERLAG